MPVGIEGKRKRTIDVESDGRRVTGWLLETKDGVEASLVMRRGERRVQRDLAAGSINSNIRNSVSWLNISTAEDVDRDSSESV